MDWEQVTVDALTQKQWNVDGPIMVMPFVDASLARRAAELAAKRASAKGLILAIEDTQQCGFVKCVNQAFTATISPWFGYLAQDAFAGRDWMALALQMLHIQRGVLLAFNDGKWQGTLQALDWPIVLGRAETMKMECFFTVNISATMLIQNSLF